MEIKIVRQDASGRKTLGTQNKKEELSPGKPFSLFNYDRRKDKTPQKDRDDPESTAAVLNELNDLIGLREVKKLVYEVMAFVEIQKKRQQENLVSEPLVLHMIFRGNPGTGKTTVARILGRLFKSMNVLTKGHLVEAERADLVGEYIGHTAQKTREQLKKSLGGILFIDEAYSLARGGEKDFGKESIDVLVKARVLITMCFTPLTCQHINEITRVKPIKLPTNWTSWLQCIKKTC